MSLVRKAINVVVTADSICPFCYLGYTKLNKAIATAKSKNLPLDFSVRFVPYQLDPTLPTTHAVSKRERFESKFGKARFEQMQPAMQSRFESEGLSITYDGVLRQTTLSHRLIAKSFHVGGESLQQKVIEEVYKTYFSEGRDIGDIEVMAPLAAKTGVFGSEEEAKTWLEGKEGLEEYQKGILEAQGAGISGVPYFKINDKWGISGAQDTELFVSVFERIATGRLV